ncbi:MAG TPA: DUF305 domain-containing protein [Sphingomicrobium sp.]|jgi:uncharacterized protein (DUF305 family)|nr:DUF305 domain-containing protein [Sphingomicrobium sp.]
MKRLFSTAAVSALTLAVAACGSNEQPTENALEANAGDNGMDSMMADPNNPFADAEMEMNEKMMAAVGTDAGDSWAKKIIEHHRGAIDMSSIVLEQNPSADVAKMARETIEKQRKDIDDIRKLLKDGAPSQQSAELYRPAMMDMHQKMMAAKGADVSETFMRKMLEHHRGGVAMSDIALQNGVSGALRRQVQKTRDDQQKDAKMIEAMLAGQSHQQAMAASGAKSAEQAKAEPAPAERASTAAKATAPKPAPKTAPRAEPKAQPKAPDPTCLPEHRAAGHC